MSVLSTDVKLPELEQIRKRQRSRRQRRIKHDRLRRNFRRQGTIDAPSRARDRIDHHVAAPGLINECDGITRLGMPADQWTTIQRPPFGAEHDIA